MAKGNLLVNGKNNVTARNKFLTDAQTRLANTNTASNVTTTPNLPTTRTSALNLGLQKAQQPVQTPIVQNNANLNIQPVQNNTTVGGAGTVAPIQQQQSRFIGLQQQPKAKSVADIAKSALYIPTAGGTAGKANKKEENRFRTNEQALLDFQADVLKKKGKMKDADIKRLYPEFADRLDVMKELQTELRPIVKNGQGVDGEQLAQYYPELIQPKNLQDVEAIRKQSETSNKKLQSNIQKVEKVVTENFDVLSPDGQKYVQDYLTLAGVVDSLKKNYRIVGGANDDEILQYAINNNPQLKGVADELQNLTLSEMDKATIDGNSQNIITSLISGLQKMTRQASNKVQNFAAEQNYLAEQFGGNTEPNVFNTTWNVAANVLGAADQTTTAGARVLGNQNVNYNVGDKDAQEAVEKQQVSDLLAMGGGYWKTVWGLATAPFEYGKLNPITKPVVEGVVEPIFEGISDLEKTITNPIWNAVGFNEQDKENADAMLLGEIFRESKNVKKDVKVRAEAARDIVSDSFKRTVKSDKWSNMKNEFQKAGIYDENGFIKPEAKTQAAKIIAREFAKDFTKNFTNDAKQWGDVVDFYRKKEGVKSIKEQTKDITEGVKNAVDTVKETGKKAGKTIANAIDKGFDKMDEGIETRIDKIKNKVTAKKPTEIKETKTEIKDEAGWSNPNKGVVSKVIGGITNVGNKINEKVVDPLATKGAEAITSTTAPQDKLFKALNPSLNVLSRKKGNYDTMRQSADRANELIIEYGNTPTNSSEYYDSIQKTKQAIWNNGIKQGLDEYKYTTIDAADLINPVREALREITKEPLESLKGDVALLEKELKAIEDRKIISLQAMEAKKQQINAILEYGLPTDASQIYEKGMRELNRQIGIQEDRMISEIPGEFKKFKRDYGALLAIQEDAQKLMIRDMKKKLGGNLIQNWSRIEGFTKLGKKGSFLEGAAQIILGEALGKVKDTNFLIESGFKGLRDQYGPAKGKPEGVKIKKKPPTPRLEDKRTDVEKGKLLEIDKRTKSNREEGYKTKNAVTSEKSAVTEKKPTPKKEEVVEKKETPKAEKELETRVETKKPEPKQEPKNKVTANYTVGTEEWREKAVDENKLDDIREYAKEHGKLNEIIPVGKERTLELENRGVMLTDAELEVLKNEGLVKESDIPETNIPRNKVTAQKTQATTKTEPKQEDKSGGNAFGLKKQKGSSRINNFTNVIAKIVDKYQDKIEQSRDGIIQDKLYIEKEPREPLEITLNGNKDQLMVRHIDSMGYDDPAILFNIQDGKLHAIGVKLAFMEQLGNYLWSRDIKDTDELLHTRAVNLEDQFLGERNIDEDTGVMKAKEDNRVVVTEDNLDELLDGSGIDRTRNANIINNIKSFDDIKDLLKPTKAGAVSDWEYEGELNGVETRVWNYGDTIFVKYGDGQGPAQARIDMADSDHIDQLKELLSEINNDGEILESNRSNPFIPKEEEPETKSDYENAEYTKESSKELGEIKTLDELKDKYGLDTYQDKLNLSSVVGMKNSEIVTDYYYGRMFGTNVIFSKENNITNTRNSLGAVPEYNYRAWVTGAIVGGENMPPTMPSAKKYFEGEEPNVVISDLQGYLDLVNGVDVRKTTTEITGKKNAVTAESRKIDNSSITGRFRNLTLDDYKKMQKYEGLEDFYLSEDKENIKRVLGIQDTLDELRKSNNAAEGAYEWNNSDFDINEHKIDLHDKDTRKAINNFVELYNLSDRVERGTYTKEDEKKYAHFIDDRDNKTNKPEWNDEYIIEEAKDEIQQIFGGDVYNPFIEDFFDEYTKQLRKDNHKNLDNEIRELKDLHEKYGKYREQGKQPLQSVDNGKNTNIIGKNNSLTTNNPTNARNGENSNGSNKGQGESSNNEGVLGVNEGGRQSVSEESRTSGGEKTLMSSSDNNSQRGTGLKDGASPAAIWTKGNDVITTKSVTQARDTNRDCVSVLEKHNYSTNPADYTEEEINTLRQYEGRGGVNDKSDLETQGALNQYYTKDNIIKAMWRLLDGYSNTDILEPSMGVGRFFMYAPEGSNLAGFEYDKIPGTIAKILYPNADIQIGDFQDNFMVGKRSVGEYYSGKKYDIVIGNPPYEERQGKQMGLGEEPKINRFDDYFIKRGIDMLKPGGHLAFVTSSQFLRGADNYAKQKISEKAELIDAYRIPVGAFDRTGVETDIVVFEKKEGGGDSELLSASKWFDKHPEKVLGEERNDIQGRFGPKTAVVGDIAAIDDIGQAHVGADGFPATLETKFTPKEVETEKPKNVITSKKTAATQDKKPKIKSARKEITPQDWSDWTETKVDKNGNETKVVWGKSYKGVLYRGKEGQKTGKLVVGKGGIGKYQNLLNPNGKIGDPSITLDSDREGLNYINGELEPNILYAAGYLPDKLEQLEKDFAANKIDEKQYNKQKDLLEQAMPEPIVFQDIDWSPYQAWILNTPTETMRSQWKSGEGYVDTPQTIKQLFKSRIGDRKDQLGTVTVTKITKDGVEKTDVQSVGTRMINALDGVGGIAPEMKDALTVKMPENFAKFMKSQGEVDENTKQKLQDEYNKRYNSYANFDYADLGYTIDDISETFMGQKFRPSDVQARGIARILTTESMLIAHGVGQGKTLEGIDGAIASMQQGKATKCLIIVPGGTKASRMQTIANHAPNQEVVDLGTLAAGSGIRDRLSDAFGHDPRNWIKPGQIAILEHSAIGKQISFKPDTLAMLQEKLTDTTNTPFSRETEIRKKEREMEKLEAENNDYWISNSQLEKNKKRLEKISGELEKIQGSTDFGAIIKRYTGKGLPDEGIMEALKHVEEDYDTYLDNMNKYIEADENIEKEKAIKIANKIYDNERPIYLEELGIDHVTVDEAHNFRNLFNKAIDTDENGEGGNWRASVDVNQGSAAAMNLYGITQYIQSQNYGGNVVLLTATPFINEPSEVYNMLSYVGKNGMEQMGVETMDDFFDTYVGLTNKQVITPSGTDVKNKNVMVQFNNTKALIRGLLDRYIDYEGESEAIVKPRQKTYVIRLKMSGDQDIAQKKLEVQIDENKFDDDWNGQPVLVEKNGEIVTLNSTRKMDDKGKVKGAVIEGMGQANNDLISPYLTKYMKHKIPDLTPKELIDTSPKLNMVVQVIKTLREYGIKRGVFVYMPVGTQLHELLQKAIELENQGIKVGIINGESRYKDMTDTQAKKLGLGDGKGARARETAKRFSDGELDVLIGGENTKEGLNLQGNGYITIEVSQPRNLNDLTQLHGRVDRQGNLSNEVLVITLLMENSSDIYRYQRMEHKNSRRMLLEMLSAYKKGEEIENVVPQGDLDLEEQKLALFTDPERKAKISIVMDKADLVNKKQTLSGTIKGLENILQLIEGWGNGRGNYRDIANDNPTMDLKDNNGKVRTTNILDDDALEPLEQLQEYYYNKATKAIKDMRPEWNKAEIDKAIRKEDPYSSYSWKYNDTRRLLSQARGDRNAVIRQMNALGIKTKEELESYLSKLHDEEKVLQNKIDNIENTKAERAAEYKRIMEENAANALDVKDILEDLKEEFRHQITLGSKEELRNWLKVTEKLPQRKQATSKSDIAKGLNKYEWESKDYIGIEPKEGQVIKNKVTSNFGEYGEGNPRPNFEFKSFVPQVTITKEDGRPLTKIGYQDKLHQGIKEIEKEEKLADEENKSLEKNTYYNTLVSRAKNNVLKLAKRYTTEIIEAYERENPELVGDTNPENFKNYINDYKIVDGKVNTIRDDLVQPGAEYLSEAYQTYLDNGEIEEQPNNVIATDKNRVTSGKTQAARANRPSIRMNVEEREKKNATATPMNKVTSKKPVNSSNSRFSPELVEKIDRIADSKGIKGNTIKKMKVLNKTVDKGKGYHTETENEIYELKKQIITEYVKSKGKTIKDKGQNKTIVDIKQGKTRVHWHVVGKLYRDLKRGGIIK